MQMKHFSRQLGLAGSREMCGGIPTLNNFAHFYAEYAPLYKSRARTWGTMNHAYGANGEARLRVQVRRRLLRGARTPRAKLENSYGEENERAGLRLTNWRNIRWNESRPSESRVRDPVANASRDIAGHLHHRGRTPKVTGRQPKSGLTSLPPPAPRQGSRDSEKFKQ